MRNKCSVHNKSKTRRTFKYHFKLAISTYECKQNIIYEKINNGNFFKQK